MNYNHFCCGWNWSSADIKATCPFCGARARITRRGKEVVFDDTTRLKDAHRRRQ